jgi:hypothetical protein
VSGILHSLLGGASVFSASLSPAGVVGGCNRPTPGSCTATTDFVTATPLNGVGPFTYEWEYVSGTPGHNPTATSGNITAFTRSGVVSDPTTQFQSFFRCKVTDSLSRIAYTGNVQVTTNHTLSS